MARDLIAEKRQPRNLLAGRPPRDLLAKLDGNPSPVKRISFGERMNTLANYGPVYAAGGAKKESVDKFLVDLAPDMYQGMGNVVGAGVGAAVGNPVAGAAYGGSVGRGVGNVMQDVGYGKKPTLRRFASGTNAGAVGELIGTGTAKAAEAFGPFAKKKAVGLMQKIFQPKGKLASKSAQIAETGLKEGLIGTKEGMLDEVYKKLDDGTKQVDDIIAAVKDKTVNPEDALSQLDILEAEYRAASDRVSADYIKNLKQNMIEDQGLSRPVYGEVKKVSVIPQTSTSGRPNDVAGISSRKTNYDTMGTPIKGQESGQFVIKKGSDSKLTTPRKIVRKETQVVGSEPKPTNLERAQELKRGQYRLLESKRAEGGYGGEVLSPEIRGRQAVARGWKQGIEGVVPVVKPLNSRLGDLVDVSTALEKRIPVADRQNIIGLGDMIFGGASFYDPRALGVLAARKFFGTDTVRSALAQGLYKSAKERGFSKLVNNPVSKIAASRMAAGGQ